MQIEPGELTRQTYDDNTRWLVRCDRQEYEVSGKQLNIIKKASESNLRGMVWFKKFAISIPHISSICFAGRDISKDKQLPERSRIVKTSKEDIKKVSEVIDDVRKKHPFLKDA